MEKKWVSYDKSGVLHVASDAKTAEKEGGSRAVPIDDSSAKRIDSFLPLFKDIVIHEDDDGPQKS